MIGLIQRVSEASVSVEGELSGRIDSGLLVLVGVQHEDSSSQVEKLCHKLLNYRVFSDGDGKMNLSVVDCRGQLLLVPQFTLAANTGKGMRPSFTSAAPPDIARSLFDELVARMSRDYQVPETGIFGADMKVSLCNDGPVTFWLEV